ncbi:S41 family peptidase [Paenibacillus tepidiphilus]|uniref:S41 family peptidase n=1 Tax=Paenibacillus tepidiphilus TaxID=2608683 RepID=UPI0013A5A996|nr:S41 family peptidase [Paenibacillus tepidiphilus]
MSEVHPRLIEGWSSDEQAVIKQAYKYAETERTAQEFYFAANEIVMLLHDGHTMLGIAPLVNAWLDLPLFWSREGLIITDKRGQLRAGDIVTAIGGRSIGELEQALKELIPAENMNWVRSTGATYLRTVTVLRHLDMIRDGQVVVEALRGKQNVSDVYTLSANYEEGYNPYPSGREAFSYSIEDDLPLAVFRLNECTYNAAYREMVKQFFSEVADKGIKHIAVDIRNNGGGNSVVIDEFLSYLKVREYTGFGALIRYSPQAKQANNLEQDQGFKQFERGVIQNPAPAGQPYDGKLYILTSPRTFSSANWFAVIVQDNGLGSVIGEATGNRPTSYGNVIPFSLPSSGIMFQTSYCSWERPDPERDPAESVFPDIEAYTTAQDILDRKDAQISKLREVVRSDLAESGQFR